jgi:hypothetical protein
MRHAHNGSRPQVPHSRVLPARYERATRKAQFTGHQPSRRGSPQADAPTSIAVARTPGMTATALLAIFQTSHRNMPTLRLEPDQISDVTEHPL